MADFSARYFVLHVDFAVNLQQISPLLHLKGWNPQQKLTTEVDTLQIFCKFQPFAVTVFCCGFYHSITTMHGPGLNLFHLNSFKTRTTSFNTNEEYEQLWLFLKHKLDKH